jgi:hypothetical protein
MVDAGAHGKLKVFNRKLDEVDKYGCKNHFPVPREAILG